MNSITSKLSLKVFIIINLLLFIMLMSINVYGLFQTLRPAEFRAEHLRFKNQDISLNQQDFLYAINRQSHETDLQYAQRLTTTIAQGIAHIHWEKYDPDKFNQTVPVWENYILYMMGKLKITPEYERYHFSNPYKSIERGIGICGDASMLMSQLLEQQNISNKIITIPGHVMVEAKINGKKSIFDPDFGVILPDSAEFYKQNPITIGHAYFLAGYSTGDNQFIINGFNKSYQTWNGIKHFITKKYYFEKASYLLKWLIPTLCFFLSIYLKRLLSQGNSDV